MSRPQVANIVAFPSTHWSLVGRAGEVSPERRREALGILLRRYLSALRAHLVVAKRISADAADDLIQGFVADKIIEQNLLAQAEQGRGRFRSFLLTALDHYAVGRFRHETASKRSPATPLRDIANQLELSADSAEPSHVFTLVWARQVIDEAKRRME